MFCCGSKKKKSKKSTKNEEPSTNSDHHSFKRDDDTSTAKQSVPIKKQPSPQRSQIQPTDTEMQRHIQKIVDLRNQGLYEQSVNYEHQYVTKLIGDENKLQCYALNYKWAVDYTQHLKNSKNNGLRMQRINNELIIGKDNKLRKELQVDSDYVLLNESAWNFILELYGGGPAVYHDIQQQQQQKDQQQQQKIQKQQQIEQVPQRKSEEATKSAISSPQYNQRVSGSTQQSKPPIPQTTQSRFVSKNTQLSSTQSMISTPKSVERQQNAYQLSQITQRNESVQNSRNQIKQQEPLTNVTNQLMNPQNQPLPIIGLRNPRYYCYMNSAFQLLLSIEPLCNGIISLQNKSGCRYLQAFQELLRTIKRQNSFNSIAAQSIWEITSGKFQFNQQQDSHEFLLFFLGKIQEELVGKYKNKQEFKSAMDAWRDYKMKNDDIIDEIFAGQSTSQSFCKSCNEVSEGYDPIWDLSLPFYKSYNGCDLMDCLKQYFKEETINDTWKCDKCKKTNKSVKRKMFLSQTPNYLIIQFKRFTSFPRSQKLNDSITYPEKLDIGNFCSQGLNTKYKLKALIMHMGQINGGHYTAYAERQSNWYHFDDEQVSKIQGRQLSEKQAYVLLYQKQ